MLTLCYISPIFAQLPSRYDVLINEIMSISPAAGSLLPDSKYLELYNASAQTYDLFDWKISDGSSTAIIKEHFTLAPGSFVIICPAGNIQSFTTFGPAIGVSRFPTLRVNGDLIWLLSDDNMVIHAVQYNRSWYHNEVKSTGGWSLEMIDTQNPCGGSLNWSASDDISGGTPGKTNSVAAIKKDTILPQLLRSYAAGDQQIILVFDKSLDSLQAARTENYLCSDNIIIEEAIPLAPLFQSILLKTYTPLAKNKVYTVEVKDLYDCGGNRVTPASVKTGLDDITEPGDLVINEILFNPPANGSDYVELYNRSTRIINAKTLYIANRNNAGNLNSLKLLHSEDFLIFPGDYIVVTDNIDAVMHNYLVKRPDFLIEISTMPSYPNASGTVVLLHTNGMVIDELRYTEKWHFELIKNPTGVSLERIDFNQPTQDKNNWYSAAASAGYGTPTYKNSQFSTTEHLQGEVKISPAIFSPDHDGYDDFLSIFYRFPEQGYVCNITIFDVQGRTIRFLARNSICGTEGFFRWDGLDEKNQRAAMGIYIILTEVYSLNGKTKKFKQSVTLARRR